MDERHSMFAPRLSVMAGLLTGALAAAILVAVGSAVAQRATDSTELFIEATHPPALLTTPRAVELIYDAYCIDPAADEPETTCDITGTAFVRRGTNGPFREVALIRDGTSRLVAGVPASIASSPNGFTYYAELETRSGRASLTLPAGGSSAPHRSLPLGRAVEIDLGTHPFGAVARADERVVAASWGDGPFDAGLEQGLNLAPIGASAFDVDTGGLVVLLDQAHRRMLRWRRGASTPSRIALDVEGTLADMTLATDGTVYVLESASRDLRTPLVRRFDSDGRSLGATVIAERGSSQIRNGPDGAMVLEQPSQQWMPVAAAGSLMGPDAQRRNGRSGRPLHDGTEVIVLREDNEIRLAVAGPAGIRRSWRITSETPLAEVQVAEPRGSDLVLVARLYTDEDDEFVVLVLDRKGIKQRFALESAEWAEAAPLARFRLAGSSLYQLGSTPTGVFVDRFDLEVE